MSAASYQSSGTYARKMGYMNGIEYPATVLVISLGCNGMAVAAYARTGKPSHVEACGFLTCIRV